MNERRESTTPARPASRVVFATAQRLGREAFKARRRPCISVSRSGIGDECGVCRKTVAIDRVTES